MFAPVFTFFFFAEPNIVHRGKLYVYLHAHGLDSFNCKCTRFPCDCAWYRRRFHHVLQWHQALTWALSVRLHQLLLNGEARWLVEDNVIEYYFSPNRVDVFKKQDTSEESTTVMGCRNALHRLWCHHLPFLLTHWTIEIFWYIWHPFKAFLVRNISG